MGRLLMHLRVASGGGSAPTLTATAQSGPWRATSKTFAGTNLSGCTSLAFYNGATLLGTVTPSSSTSGTVTATLPPFTQNYASLNVVATTAAGNSGTSGNGIYSVVWDPLVSISPASGSVAGGDVVTITSVDVGALASPSVLQLGGADIAILTNNGTTITGTTGEHDIAAVVDLLFTSANGSKTFTGAFTYAMKVTNVFPAQSELAGGIPITVFGKGFSSLSIASLVVKVNGVTCTAAVVLNDEQIAAVTTTGSAGTGVVSVSDGAITATGATFEYWDFSSFTTDLVAEWDMDQGLVPGVGSGCSQVNDKSGNGNALVQATGGNQPTVSALDAQYSGRQVLRFPLGSTSLYMSCASITLADPYTVIFFGHDPGTSGTDVLYSVGPFPFSYISLSGNTVTATDSAGGSFTGTTYAATKPALFIDQRSGATSKIWVDSVETPLATGTPVGSAGSPFILGNTAFFGNSMNNGAVAYCVVIRRALTSTELKKVQAFFAARYHQGNPSPSVTQLFTGNSLIFGGIASNPSVTDLVDRCIAGLPRWYECFKDGNPGIATTALKTGSSGLPFQTPAPEFDVLLWEITNDITINGVSAATGLGNMQAWITRYKNAGARKVTVLTCLPRSSAGWPGTFEAIRLSINASLISGATPRPDIGPRVYDASALGANVRVVDVAANPALANSAGSNYAGDGVHLNNSGHAIATADVLPALIAA